MEETIRTDIASFWTSVKRMNNKKVPQATSVNGVVRSVNICDMWKTYCSQILNCASTRTKIDFWRRRCLNECQRWLVAAVGLCIFCVFPGLQCEMMLVVASIGSEGLLGTEVLQSCLPHQFDLCTGHLWSDGQSILQLHQQRQAVQASVYTAGSLVVPPDSENVVPVSIQSRRGSRRGLIEPDLTLTENYGVLVGRTKNGQETVDS